MADYDEREEELSTIAAIFPELVIDEHKPFAASIHLPVAPSTPLPVRFTAASTPAPTVTADSAPLPSPPNSEDGKQTAHDDVRHLHYLPPLHLNLILPEGYPGDKAPQVSLSTDPDWLPAEKLRQLSEGVESLWEDYGRCQILFSYIDHLQQAAERAFDLHDKADLTLPFTLKAPLLDLNTKTERDVFNAQTFDCGICLEPKKGSECYRLNRCHHVFCRACLQDSYGAYIKEGDIVHVRCLDPTCGNEKAKKRKGNKTLHPSELLDMDIPDATVRRYVDMKRKKRLEADKTTIYCPRSWCQAPARSAKYPPIPLDLREYLESEGEDETATDGNATSNPTNPSNSAPADGKTSSTTSADRLCICSNPSCTLAFCRVCYSGWHGEFARCWPRNASELTEEEKASYDYIRMHTSPCPECSTPVQKTMGCNHMICFQCQTHFCYLCGAWLDGADPYRHYNRPGTCYQKLWELEEGDEGQAAPFAGGRMWELEAIRVAEEADRAEAERLQDQENEAGVLMDAEDEIHANLPILLNGGQIPPEAPEPPPAAARFGHNDDHEGFYQDFVVVQEQQPRRGRGGRLQQQQNMQHNRQQNQQRDRGRGGRGRGAARGGRGRGGAAAAPGVQPNAAGDLLDEEAVAAALREFVELAVLDQEDDWDSDGLGDEDDGRWQMGPPGPRVRHQGGQHY